MVDGTAQDDSMLASTGIDGLDDVLRGGLARDRLYVVEGDPGSGKTTLALQFLLAGAAEGERCLLVTLSESEHEIRASAASHGWTLDAISVLEIGPEDEAGTDAGYRMFHPSEVELAETTKRILTETERVRPVRLVLDSLSELRLLAESSLRYRREILALKQYFQRQNCTVLFIDDRTGDARDMHLHSLAHGVICLERETPDYGTLRRRLRVEKMRGRSFREGHHDYVIRRGGLAAFPRLVAGEHTTVRNTEAVPSGVAPLDALLGGGLTRGTSTLLIGAAGTGKSSIGAHYGRAAGERGERACIFLFDESVETCMQRSEGLGMDLAPLVDAKLLTIRQVDPAELSPGEFAYDVRRAVEEDQARLVVIDSLNGYLNAMPTERYLTLHLHELLTYLGHRNVTTLLLMTQHGFFATEYQVPVDASYLADTVMLLRYFEAFGEVRQAISVIKKRTGPHERTIRELRLGGGIWLGEPLRELQGVLSGIPQRVGSGNGGLVRASDGSDRAL
jgi:circadian clock protein KaiC